MLIISKFVNKKMLNAIALVRKLPLYLLNMKIALNFVMLAAFFSNVNATSHRNVSKQYK